MANSTATANAKTTTIRATSRASIKIRDNYFTVEYSEERIIPDINWVDGEIDLDEERRLLWETVNNECDNQIEELKDCFKK